MPPTSALSNDVPAPARQLGQFLRACRDRLSPEDFGLAGVARRRAPGLRREEAAALCGISPTWYTWIEQGRAGAISAPTLGAIARGLRLSRAERAYLLDLAARPEALPRRVERAAPDDLAALVGAIRTPAYLLDLHWDAIAWNRPAAALFDDWLGAGRRGRTPDRNLLRYVFLHPRAPSLIVNWPERGRRLVAEFRADTAAASGDPLRQTVVDQLSRDSAAFAAAWRSQSVRLREGGERAFHHPRLGACRYQQFTLRLSDRPDLKLTTLVPAP